ncbi:MAG: hypothetical protein HZB68_05375 [Candidatus Aenigmarchaeota archaeon]|nr:hypothetical protein [Candidatus Aenigmarchaeota archaeon]
MGKKSDPFGMYDGIDVPKGDETAIVDGNMADALYIFGRIDMNFDKIDGLYTYRYYSTAPDNALMGVFCHLLGEDGARELYDNVKKTFSKDGLYARSTADYRRPEIYTSACVGLLAFSLGEREEAERIFNTFLKTDKDEIDGLFGMAILGKVLGRDGEANEFYDRAMGLSTNETLYAAKGSGYYDTKNSALKLVYHKLAGKESDDRDIFKEIEARIPKNNGLFVWGSHMMPSSSPSIDDSALVGIYLCLRGGMVL